MKKKILICPLNWGLGHATRCVPIIRTLLDLGHDVMIAADKSPLAFLQKEFPDLKFIKFPGFEPTYSKGNSQVFKLLKSIPDALINFKKEHKAIEKIVDDYNIDLIISDNRFGCWSKKVRSIYITHQLHIQVPKSLKWTYPIVNLFHKTYINKYDELWIPDVEGEPSLSGKLSHPADVKIKTQYIGFLSRFTSEIKDDIKIFEYLVILSGPEPQRTIFEDIIIKQAHEVEGNIAIFRAKPELDATPDDEPSNVYYFNHVDDVMFRKIVSKSRRIVCRGGYSSLMDLVNINRNAYLVPTPGQTEQEYLAEYLTEKGLFNYCKQKDFKLKNVKIPKINLKNQFKIKDVLEDILKEI
ncbi:MAG: hypothetical protein IJA42_04725 [Bacteroidales bacterium]|nr:hypothetical protein [Bacteroidales bacterium]